MASNDITLTIKRYTLNLGFRTVSTGDSRDIVPYHQIGLTGVANETGQEISITIELWSDLRQFAPTELGFYNSSSRTITIKAPISEFGRASDLLRNEKPVFLVFNQLNIPGAHDPGIKSITSASIVTKSEPTGEGEHTTGQSGLLEQAVHD
jgi:hypothetical protein